MSFDFTSVVTLRVTRLDGSGEPLDLTCPMETLGQVKMITLHEEPVVEESPWTIEPKRWSFTWKLPRYGIGRRREFNRLLGVSVVEHHRGRRKGKR